MNKHDWQIKENLIYWKSFPKAYASNILQNKKECVILKAVFRGERVINKVKIKGIENL